MPKRAVLGMGVNFLNMRVTPILREMVEQACAKSGRSISAEVSYRVERTFMEDELRREKNRQLPLVVWTEGRPI